MSSNSSWQMCRECAQNFNDLYDPDGAPLADRIDPPFTLVSEGMPEGGFKWFFRGNSTYECEHLHSPGRYRSAEVFRGKYTRKTLGYRSLADQEKGGGSPASKMKPYYRP